MVKREFIAAHSNFLNSRKKLSIFSRHRSTTSNGLASANVNINTTNNERSETSGAKPKNISRPKPIKYEYDMNHKHRGLAIILNQYIFDHGLQMGQRRGTRKDCDALKSTFERLGFKVQLHDDLRLDQVCDVLREGKLVYIFFHLTF